MKLIPLPKEYKKADGYFKIDSETKISSQLDLPLIKSKLDENGDIKITLDPSLDDEAYKMNIIKSGIQISASSSTGAYYALQSLRQLSSFELGGGKVECCKIEDSPHYRWRGIELDESRHFFGIEEVKRLLDMMFMMKLNVFHWHLTDDSGWRIEIKKYPLLTEIGSVRAYTHINGWKSTDIINEKYEGFYTQDEIKQIIAYAEERGIMIVPEIDFPAHSAAAIAAYPHLACRELKREVPGYFGGSIPEKKLKIYDWNRPVCVGKESVIDFIKDIIDEICELFPAPYYHIGGDETDIKEWEKCPECQKRVKENNLGNTNNLQSWFNNILVEYLKSKGKTVIAWNDILKAQNVDSSTVIQYWTPLRDKRAEEYAKSGAPMIISKHQAFYFDMTYGQYPLKNTYSFSAEKYHLPDSENILGVEGECWSEWIDGRAKLELNLYPRMQALSEVAWCGKCNDYTGFEARLNDFKPYFEKFGIGYAVDKVSSPSILNGLKARKKFYNGDTHSELKLNNEYKAKGEK